MLFLVYSVTLILTLHLTLYQKSVLSKPQGDCIKRARPCAFRPPWPPIPDPRTTEESEPDPGPTWCIMWGYPCGPGIDGRCCEGLFCAHWHKCAWKYHG